MKKLIFVALAVVAFLYRHQIEAYLGKSQTIDLTVLNAEIPVATKHPFALTLKRGAFAYVFYKKEALSEAWFRVVRLDVLNLAAEHRVWPEEAYARILEVVPVGDEAATRAVRALAAAAGPKGGKAPDPADMKALDGAKFTVGILPTKKTARDPANGIIRAGTVRITGTHYELSEVTENGTSVPLKDSRAVRHLFLADGLLTQVD